MKPIYSHVLATVLMITLFGIAATAQTVNTSPPKQPPLRPRGAGQQPDKAANSAARQAAKQGQNLTADQPNRPKLNEQQRNKREQTLVDTYVGGFQKNVGLSDEQTRKFSGVLGGYVRQQLRLAQNKKESLDRLKELTDQQAPQEEIQAQSKIQETIEAQQYNTQRRFFAQLNPELTPQQQANLKLYLENTGQNIRQAIQKSQNNK
jgi:hypothetical protein